MSPTFAELGIPFPLFEAPVTEAFCYAGQSRCSVCRRHAVYCFELGIGAYVIVPCSVCDAANTLPVVDRAAQPCRICQHPVAFPNMTGQPPLVCYDCLRAGKAVFTHDTVLGMVGWEEAVAGQTRATPEPTTGIAWISDGADIVGADPMSAVNLYGVERVLMSREPALVGGESMDWYASRVPREYLFELLRTPTYGALQGEKWLFHCGQPMVYLGPWAPLDFQQRAPDGNGRAFFNAIVAEGQWLPDELWASTSGAWGAYVFRCAMCGQLAAHWDVD